MSQQDLQSAVEDLQIRLSHQDLTIEALSETVAQQQRLIAELQAQLEHVNDIVRELRPSPLGPPDAAEPPPPHY